MRKWENAEEVKWAVEWHRPQQILKGNSNVSKELFRVAGDSEK